MLAGGSGLCRRGGFKSFSGGSMGSLHSTEAFSGPAGWGVSSNTSLVVSTALCVDIF